MPKQVNFRGRCAYSLHWQGRALSTTDNGKTVDCARIDRYEFLCPFGLRPLGPPSASQIALAVTIFAVEYVAGRSRPPRMAKNSRADLHVSLQPKSGAEELREDGFLPHPVKLRDMICESTGAARCGSF